jgi:hypothetical protein
MPDVGDLESGIGFLIELKSNITGVWSPIELIERLEVVFTKCPNKG